MTYFVAHPVEVNEYQSATDTVDIKWGHFDSSLGVKFYYIGLSTSPTAADIDCNVVVSTNDLQKRQFLCFENLLVLLYYRLEQTQQPVQLQLPFLTSANSTS